jgi:hypothetical protein
MLFNKEGCRFIVRLRDQGTKNTHPELTMTIPIRIVEAFNIKKEKYYEVSMKEKLLRR